MDIRRDQLQLVMKCFRQRREELYHMSASIVSVCRKRSHLRFSRVSLMALYSNLVKVAMKLIYDGRDLLRQVSSVHCEKLPAAL